MTQQPLSTQPEPSALETRLAHAASPDEVGAALLELAAGSSVPALVDAIATVGAVGPGAPPVVVAAAAGDDAAVRRLSYRHLRGPRASTDLLERDGSVLTAAGVLHLPGASADVTAQVVDAGGRVLVDDVAVVVADAEDWNGGRRWRVELPQDALTTPHAHLELLVDDVAVRVAAPRATGRLAATSRLVPAPGLDLVTAEPVARPGDDVPTLSVVVTSHDIVTWLDDCLSSILRQDVPAMEVVVVDDHSADGGLEVLREYAARDPRVTVLRTEQRGGANGRNVGVAAASGRYLVFADGDDVVPDGAYAAMLASAAETGSDLVFGDYMKFSSSRTWWPTARWPAFRQERRGITLDDEPSLIRGRACWNKLVRRDFWAEHGIEYPETPRSNDIVPMVSAYLAARTIDVVRDCVYVYRQRPGLSSMTSKAGSATSIISYLRQERRCAELVGEQAEGSRVVSRYFAMVLESDTWMHVLNFLRDDDVTCTDAEVEEIVAHVRALVLASPRHVVVKLEPRKQLVLALVAAGRLDAAQALALRSWSELDPVEDGDVDAEPVDPAERSAFLAEELERWTSGLDTVAADAGLEENTGIGRVLRGGLLEPVYARIAAFDDATLERFGAWLSAFAPVHDKQSILGEVGRTVVSALDKGGVAGLRALSSAAADRTATLETVAFGPLELRLRGTLDGAEAVDVPVTLVGMRNGASRAKVLGRGRASGGAWEVTARVRTARRAGTYRLVLRLELERGVVVPLNVMDGQRRRPSWAGLARGWSWGASKHGRAEMLRAVSPVERLRLARRRRAVPGA